MPETNALLALAVPEAGLADNIRNPTTLNFFAMPNAYFFYTLGMMAQTFAWSAGVNVVCGATNDNLFLLGQCEDFDGYWTGSDTSRNLAYQKYFLSTKAVAADGKDCEEEFLGILSKISGKRGENGSRNVLFDTCLRASMTPLVTNPFFAAALLLMSPVILRNFLVRIWFRLFWILSVDKTLAAPYFQIIAAGQNMTHGDYVSNQCYHTLVNVTT